MALAVQMVLAVLLGTAGGALAYLASPNQRLLARPGPPRRNLALAAASGVAALALFAANLGPATAAFSLLTLLMGVFTALPFLALLRRPPGTPR